MIGVKELYHLEPIYKSFIWAGRKLINRFHIETDLDNVGTIYCAIALPGELDNRVTETGQPLSEFYETHPEVFACDEEHFPIRMTVTCNEGFQSYQLHPDDEYALEHEGCRGKVSGAVALDESEHVATWLFGHKAEDLDEFKQLVENKDWENLFTTLEVKDGDFVHTPAGVIHGGEGGGTVSATFGTNGDITYRFYDQDRNDPNRPLHLDDVYGCVHFPEVPFFAERPIPVQEGDLIRTDYHDVDGEYVAKRLKVNGQADYAYDTFFILTNVDGRGSVDGQPLDLGHTVLVPANHGPVALEGTMDCIMISYHAKRA